MVPPWSRPLLTLGIVLLLAGCAARLAATGQGPEPAAEPKVSGASSAAVAAATLPLDAYVPTDDQMELLNRARGLLMRDCMRRLGFADWQPPDPRVAHTRPPLFPFGIVDRQQAALYGYHDPHGPEVVRMLRQQPAVSAAERARQRAELAALTGDSAFGRLSGQVPAAGCDGEADRKMRQDAPSDDVNLYGTLVDQATQRTAADTRVAAVNAAWSRCMRRAGFEYQSPQEPGAPEANRWPTPRPTPVEIATARADVACKQKTGLAGVWLGVLAAYERQLIEQHKLALDQVKRELDHQIRKANQILEGQRR